MSNRKTISHLIIALSCLTFWSCHFRGIQSEIKDASQPSTKMNYWLSEPRRGANFFNNLELKERFSAARDAGIQFVRLAPNKWLNGRPASEVGHFLLGPPTKFEGVNAEDLAFLKTKLDEAHQSGLKVVLTMLSLPAHRWNQHNNGTQERRLWQEMSTWNQAFHFWQEVAKSLKDHPAVVGYNILNEPSPELLPPRLENWYTGDYEGWYQKVKGTAADTNLFYKQMVESIREVDVDTPIILDAGFYATPWAFKVLEPVADANVLYAFHMYEPYRFTSHENNGEFAYPGSTPIGEGNEETLVKWNRDELNKILAPVRDWQTKHHIHSNRIIAAEFGAYRRNVGVEKYLEDLISLFNEQSWHWAFYSFREDDWEGMDYELGTEPPPAKYWEYIEQGRMPGGDVYRGSKIFDVIRNGVVR